MWDNSPESDDPGIALEAALEIATMLAGTTFNLRTMIETTFGWECTADLCSAVEKIVNRCQCGLWMPAYLDRALCIRCAMRRAGLVESIKWNPTADDLVFLAAIGAAEPSQVMENDRVQLKGTPVQILGNLADWPEKLTPEDKAKVRFERLESTGQVH